jgi:hypothetical protein
VGKMSKGELNFEEGDVLSGYLSALKKIQFT